MVDFKLQKDNALFTSGADIREICRPLFDLYGFTYFGHRRIFKDGTAFIVSSNAEVVVEAYRQGGTQFEPNQLFCAHGDLFVDIHSSALPSKLINIKTRFRDIFNMDYYCILVEKNSSWTDIYIFANMPGNYKILNLYMQEPDILKRFVLYYKEKAAELLNKAKSSRIIIPHSSTNDHMDKMLLARDESVRTKFHNLTPITKYYLKKLPSNTYLTAREFECLELLASGKSSKEIGRALNISNRTVESYIRNIKDKTDCHRKPDLIEFFRHCKI